MKRFSKFTTALAVAAALVVGVQATPTAPAAPMVVVGDTEAVRVVTDAMRDLRLPQVGTVRVIQRVDLQDMVVNHGGTVLGVASGRDVYLRKGQRFWNKVSVLAHELGHVVHRQGGLDIAPVIEAAAQTASVRDLRAKAAADDSWAEYAAGDTEVFARAFAQWLANRSGDERWIAATEALGSGQWAAEDFTHIAPALDQLFEA
jgi:hypothetical protein